MKVTVHRFDLPLEHEFTIARGSVSVQPSVVVEVQQDGLSGLGEATTNPYYHVTQDTMATSVDYVRGLLESASEWNPSDLWTELQAQIPNDMFTLSAIDQALWDLYGQLKGQPTWKLMGLESSRGPVSSYTIGIDTVDVMVAKLQEQPGWPVYKIKLGANHQVDIVRELRQHTAAQFRIDANCGWTVDETIRNSTELQQLGVEFIEQPLPAEASEDDHRRVREQSVLPIVADESCSVEQDVARCDGLFDGINIKLCKCGGLTPAYRMLQDARQRGLQTMVGCMVESSVGISATAQLLPLLDYADLDGAVLLAEDIADGVVVDRGQVRFPAAHGNGVVLR